MPPPHCNGGIRLKSFFIYIPFVAALCIIDHSSTFLLPMRRHLRAVASHSNDYGQQPRPMATVSNATLTNGGDLSASTISVETPESLRVGNRLANNRQSTNNRWKMRRDDDAAPSASIPSIMWNIFDQFVNPLDAIYNSDGSSRRMIDPDVDTIRLARLSKILLMRDRRSAEFLFNVPFVEGEQLIDGQLTMWWPSNGANRDSIASLDIFYQLSTNDSSSAADASSTVDHVDSTSGNLYGFVTSILPPRQAGEFSVDVTSALATLERTNSTDLILLVRLVQRRTSSPSVGQIVDDTAATLFERMANESESRPALLLFARDKNAKAKRRVSRSGGVGDGNSKRRNWRTNGDDDGGGDSRRPSMCRRRPIHIDFVELNWQDWIVAPHGLDSYYCAGECRYPITDYYNTTNHAIVQALVNSVSPGATPPPCCVPTAMSDVAMLYLDINDRIVIKNYPNMIVDDCGCR